MVRRRRCLKSPCERASKCRTSSVCARERTEGEREREIREGVMMIEHIKAQIPL